MFVFVAFWRLSCAFWLEESPTEGNLVYFLSVVLLNKFLAFELRLNVHFNNEYKIAIALNFNETPRMTLAPKSSFLLETGKLKSSVG